MSALPTQQPPQPAAGDPNQLLGRLMAMLQAQGNSGGNGAAMAAPLPVFQQAPAVPAAQGVLVPLTVPLGNGAEARVYLHFGPECATPEAIVAVITALSNAGYPVGVFQRRDQQGFGGGGNGGNGGGWGNRGGNGWRGGNGGGGGYGGGNRWGGRP